MRWLSGKSDDLPKFHPWDHLVEFVLLSPLTHVCAYIQYISIHIININKTKMKNKYPLKIKPAIRHKGILKLLIKYLEKQTRRKQVWS